MKRHQNPDGTYDGAAVLGELSGLGRETMASIWEEVKSNHAKLNACQWHEFEPVLPLATKPRYRCKNCGGEIDSSAFHWHEQGRRGPSAPAHLARQLATVTDQRDALARELLTPAVFHRLLDWLREDPIRPASTAFTAGIERQIAYALEMDVLPEVKRLRIQLQNAKAER